MPRCFRHCFALFQFTLANYCGIVIPTADTGPGTFGVSLPNLSCHHSPVFFCFFELTRTGHEQAVWKLQESGCVFRNLSFCKTFSALENYPERERERERVSE